MTAITVEQARTLLSTFDHCSAEHQLDYLNKGLVRMVATINLLPELPPGARVLELGASPYFMTTILSHHFPYQLELANEPYWLKWDNGHVELRDRKRGLLYKFDYKAFNIETDPYPYEDGSFDAVFYCEMIEHLMHDPTHSLYEIHRILKPGGYLMLTTPNPFRYTNYVRFLRGKNIYPPFSGWGPYGRHNREFSANEMRLLLKQCNYDVEDLITTYDPAYDHPRLLDGVARRLHGLGLLREQMDVIHLRARAFGQPIYRYPPELYLDVHAYQRIVNDNVEMGVNDEAQLGEGFYKLECWPPHVRWTEQRAMIKLVAKGHSGLAVRFYSGPKQLARKVAGTISIDGTSHSFSVDPGEWAELRFPLAEATAGEVAVGLDLEKTWVPREVLGNPDTRKMGVAVQRIWLE